jgi:hypothetical protein
MLLNQENLPLYLERSIIILIVKTSLYYVYSYPMQAVYWLDLNKIDKQVIMLY